MTAGPRLAFCCKYFADPPDAELSRRMNTTTITMASLAKAGEGAHARLIAAVGHNLAALRLQIGDVAARPPIERAFRMVSDILPGYNNALRRPHYDEPELRGLVESGLAAAGRTAREGDVRLSMHPDQFCTLASLKPAAVENAIGELEYHADIFDMMGLAGGWHPGGAHVNIHGGARAAGIEGFRAGFARLSARARDLVTVENDEVSFGLDDLLPLADELPIVLDLHHHWIHSRGRYIEPEDPRILRIAQSWRGTRPMSHVSVSREDVLCPHDARVRPDFAALVEAGLKPGHLRAHSDLMWNAAINDLVGRHLAWTDFEVEAKHKNLASAGLARYLERRADVSQAA